MNFRVHQPIACTLDGQSAGQRVLDWRALGQAAMTDCSLGSGSVVARYSASPAVEERLLELARAETHCCAFARFHVSREGEDTLLLEISGPPGTERMFGFLAADAPSRR